MITISSRFHLLPLLVACLSLLSACGGGGSSGTGSTASAAPAVAAGTLDAEVALDPLVLSEAVDKSVLAASPSAVPTAQNLRQLEMAYLGSVMSTDLLPYAHIEVPAVENLRAMNDGGGGFLGFRTYGGQPIKNSGVRAESSIDYPFQEGETIRYSWRFGITSDFQSDPGNRWWLFGDLHDQPDPRLGQTWADYPSHSPSIGLGYGRIDGKDNLALLYGAPNPTTRGLVPFTRGVWHSVVLEVHWSRGADGSVALYLDNAKKPALKASGANMYNAYQHYLKLGSYRQPDIQGDSWVYVRDVKIQRIAR